MIHVFFVRHAQPVFEWDEERTRPLTEEGRRDAREVTRFFADKKIDAFYSSPFHRSYDTIAESATRAGKPIITDERLRERRKGVSGNHLGMFRKRWADHDYHEEGGESLSMVRSRNVAALRDILAANARADRDVNIVIGTHATALSSILSDFDPSFDHDSFLRILNWMPYILEVVFDGEVPVDRIEHFHLEKKYDVRKISPQDDDIPRTIHILGASGAGTTTLGEALRDRFGYTLLDSDDYFWLPTDPRYTTPRSREERQRLLSGAIATSSRWILSGSSCGWGDRFIPLFEKVILVEAPMEVRIERLKKRESDRFGERILPGGDMYEAHQEFLAWAARYETAGSEQRSRALHDEWLMKVTCPIVVVDGTTPVDEMVRQTGIGHTDSQII